MENKIEICKGCGKEMASEDQYINTSLGIYCQACWEKVPSELKYKAAVKNLSQNIAVTAYLSNKIFNKSKEEDHLLLIAFHAAEIVQTAIKLHGKTTYNGHESQVLRQVRSSLEIAVNELKTLVIY